jgi:hypothetical protein
VARVDGLSESTLDALRALGVAAAYEHDRLTLAGLRAGQEPDVIARLVAGGARVFSFEPRHEGQEQRFLALMEGGSGYDDAGR